MWRTILTIVYVVSAFLEVVGLATVFNPGLEEHGGGTAGWISRRSGAWLIGVGIVIGLGDNIGALYLSN
jgi:hypothetical protein